jgi:hypothetical protein
MRALKISTVSDDAIRETCQGRAAEEVAESLQAAGLAATTVADASDTSTDAHLWSRRFFGLAERRTGAVPEGRYPHVGPAWGHGPVVEMEESRPVGADSADVLREIGGLSEAEIARLFERGATASSASSDLPMRRSPAAEALRVERGELSRIDATHDGWRITATNAGVAL